MGKITIEIAYNSVMASFWKGQKGVFNDKVLVINKMPPFFLYPFSTPSTFNVASSWHICQLIDLEKTPQIYTRKRKNPTKPTKNVKKAHFFNNKKDF